MSYLHPPVRILFVLASEHVLGFDTYGVSLVPYVLASSSPRCPHRSKRPNRPRAFRVFFWSLQHQFVLWGDGGGERLANGNGNYSGSRSGSGIKYTPPHTPVPGTSHTPLVDQQTVGGWSMGDPLWGTNFPPLPTVDVEWAADRHAQRCIITQASRA